MISGIGKKELEFAIFCIENIAIKLNLNAQDVYRCLKTSGIIDDYIFPEYEALHTQGKEYIIEDILELVRIRGIFL